MGRRWASGPRGNLGGMAEEERTQNRGLVGGRLDLRARHGREPDLDHAAAFDLYGPHAEEHRRRAAEFVRHRPLEIEIGFGHGQFLASLAAQRPGTRFLGFEVRTRWCRSLLERVDAAGLENVRLLRGDFRAVLPDLVPDGVVDAVYLLFPDPWWKKRHHKRRVLTADTVALIERKLAPGGNVWVKSDVPATITLADEAFATASRLRPTTVVDDDLPRTHREDRCARVGLPVMARCYRKPVAETD